MADSKIVRAVIHPGIGVARVGNSPHEFFIGPEVPYPTPPPPGGYKDGAQALKRQAARFLIYGYDQNGNVVEQLTADNAEIEWTVHVANSKAAWYNFEIAMDIPEAVPAARRNGGFVGEDRRKLIIDPGTRSIKGKNQGGGIQYKFDSGRFIDEKVYLGELRTDDKGSLVFLGGHGVSNSPFPNNTASTFGNNNGWHDDTSDGPVCATVKIKGRQIPVEPAWVVVAPPNYAPDIISVQTMYDVMYDVYQGNWLTAPATVSFTEHIYPILSEFVDSQWVNFGFFVQFGWQAPYDFTRPDFLAKLADNKQEYQELRRQIFNMFRSPEYKLLEIDAWPQMYGDDVSIPPKSPRSFLAVTSTQYKFLKKWVDGDFESDWNPHASANPQRIEDVELRLQPETLDKAAMHFCLGGPFHPGCEMTWPMRQLGMYYAPFRIRPRAANEPEPDYGEVLTPQVALGPNGPLYSNGPGDITRWMAVPWQTDTASCRAGYDEAYDPYLPTFWPARVPNHVLSQDDYEKVLNPSLPKDERVLAFNTRATWYRWLKGAYLQQINEMVTEFGSLGVVERMPGVAGDPDFPPVMYVESQVGFTEPDVPARRNTIVGAVEKVTRHSGDSD